MIIMTQEGKQLLFPVLSAMLPYHIRVKIWLKDGTTEEGVLDLEHNYGDVLRDAFYYDKIVDIKPYLRSMESMTAEERKVYIEISSHLCGEIAAKTMIDWLNKKMFDYCGLIPMGLALEAPEGMYNN